MGIPSRIGLSQIAAPLGRKSVNKENVAPQTHAPAGRQARIKPGVFADLGTRPRAAGRMPLRPVDINASAAQSASVASKAQPRSVRTAGHGLSASSVSVQHYRERVLNQIEGLPVAGGKQAWRKPIETMELLDRHTAHLPPAQTIKLLQQMQVILSIKDTRTRDANLDHFMASLKPAVAQQAAAKPTPATATRVHRPMVPAQSQKPQQPSKLSFNDFEGLAPLRQQRAGQTAVAATPVRAPQYGRSVSADHRPARAKAAEPVLTLADFERDEEQAADYHGHARPDYGRAQEQYANYLARRQPAPERPVSAPPRMQTAAAPMLSRHDMEQIRRAEDDRARYHGEVPNYQQAYARHLARQRPMPSAQASSSPQRMQRVQARPLTAQELQSIHQEEAGRARYHGEVPDYAGAEARYRAQHGR